VLDADGATIGTGGGITALSVPEEELEEVYLKAAALLHVLGVTTER
jgi:anthranilate synthase component 1